MNSEALLVKLCTELGYTYDQSSHTIFGTVTTFRINEDCSLVIDIIQKYLNVEDYKEGKEKICGVPGELLEIKEDRNYKYYYLPLTEITYEIYKNRLKLCMSF